MKRLNNQGAEYNNPVIERTYRQLAYGPYARMVISLPTNNNTANIPFYPIIRLVQGNTEDTTDPNYNEFNPDIHVVLKVYVVTAFGYGIVENLNIMVSSIGVSKNPDWNYAGEGYKSSFIHSRSLFFQEFDDEAIETHTLFGLEHNEIKLVIDQEKFLLNIPSWVILSKIVNFGFIKITPFKKEDSELQFWTRSKDPDKNKDTLIQLYNCVFLQGYDKAHDL
ncbi:unnamed protein product [Rhizophagus irregularis]|nr:unnamed protein product [Rhizophagus irregularis]